ncbi:hypothetical protein ACJIZ3_008749 [Penstemon smallii]|uniref:Uncharacterized protein n=1 Tax=Penstemon smallii TaxID=265156 RepID=A0ABD3TC90_9LAMI
MNSCQLHLFPLTKELYFNTSNNTNQKLHTSHTIYVPYNIINILKGNNTSKCISPHPYPQLNFSFQTAFHLKNHI